MASRTLDIVLRAKDQASQTLNGLSGTLEKNKASFRSMAAVGTATFAAVTGVVVSSTKAYAEFDTTLNRIAGLVGINRDMIQGWERDIKYMAVETGISSRKLADALYFITSAGISGSEALEVLEMSAKAAAAGLGETQTVADLVTSAMNAYGSEVLNAQQATDILVATVREGKAEPAALAASMGQVLPIASELGVSFDQVGAAIAGMTRTGTDAATASTQLRQILASLLNPSAEAKKMLGELGLTAGELRQNLKEDGLISVLSELKDSFGDNEEAAGAVFGNIRALSGVLDLLGSNAEENIAIFEKMSESGGALDQAFEATEDTTRAWERFKVQLENVRITIGDGVAPALVDLMNKISPVIQKITQWAEENSVLTKNILLLVGAAGGLIAVFGLISLALPGIIAMFTLLSSPITLVITALLMLGVAIYQFVKNSRYILEQFGLFFKYLWQLVIKPLIDQTVEWFSEFGDKIRNIFNSLKTFFVNIWNSIKMIFKSAIDWIMDKLEPFLNMVNKVTGAVSKVGSAIGSGISKAGGAIGNFFGFAEGGIITKPTLGLVGEAGPEAIVPLNRLSAIGAGNVSVNVNVYGDVSGEELVNKVESAIVMSLKKNMKL